MKKVVDLSAIEAREKELLEELAELRAFKRYATKFGHDYGPPPKPILPVVDVPASPPQPIVSNAAVMDAVKNAILSFGPNNFNYQEIEKVLKDSQIQYSRSAIFDAISTMRTNGEIEIVEKGAGRRPAKYKITESFNPFTAKGEE